MSGTTPAIYEYKTEREFAKDAAQAIEDFILWKLTEQPCVRIGLSGGESPKAVYETLAKNKKIDWEKIELFMVDERYVPKDHPQSNFKMIEETLLSKIPPIRSFYDFNTDLDLLQAAEQYDELLEKKKGNLDLVILGLGTDGHTASLFPETEALKERIKLATIGKSPDGMERLTLTYTSILGAEKIMFLIRGKEKKEVLKKLVGSEVIDPLKMPAKIILQHPHVEIYFEAS